MKVICFGDSNTFGYDPCPWSGGRYDSDSRWVDILAAKTGWTVSNMGCNGRKIPNKESGVFEDADMLIIMLGTNDLLQGQSANQAAEKLKRFLCALSLERSRILLIAPPPLSLGDWVQNRQLLDNSYAFSKCCHTLAEQMHIRFLDAGKWNIPLARDGVHFTQQGHKAFAAGLLEELT